MAERDQRPPAKPRPSKPRASDQPAEQMDAQDEAVAESFPASDPPARSGIIGPRRKPRSRPAGAS
jgi:hypothetical protein